MRSILVLVSLFLVACAPSNSPHVLSNHNRSSLLHSSDSFKAPGTISGQVLSLMNDVAIEGARVTIKRGGQIITTVTTDANGIFKVVGLPAETYDVIADHVSYSELAMGSVPVLAGSEVTTHFILTPFEEPVLYFLSASLSKDGTRFF